MAWFAIFIPVMATVLLLVFFRKKVEWFELLLCIGPSALLILFLNWVMVTSQTTDTEYLGNYIVKVNYYEKWDEEVSCRHDYKCNCSTDKDGHESCSTCYEHSYDVDVHPPHWTKEDANGNEYGISQETFLQLQKQFDTKPYFVDMHRDYHSIDGDCYSTDWNKKPETADVVTTTQSYTNKIKASHSIFKFEDINDSTKKQWKLYDYPSLSWLYQQMVLGRGVDYKTDRKLQYLNGFYGFKKQFRMYLLFYKDQPIEVAFKQRSYWEGGNKNEFVVCVGTDSYGRTKWVKCFSWMDKPALEVRVESWINKTKGKALDLNEFADWMPNQIEQHWERKRFRDFNYLEVELTGTQLMWLMIIVALYNIGISAWIVFNEFAPDDEERRKLNSSIYDFYNKRKRRY